MLLSEPTGSVTRWEDNFRYPFITFCPYHNLKWASYRVLYCGTAEERQEFYENSTLVELFKREGLTLEDMVIIHQGLMSDDFSYPRHDDSYVIKEDWKSKIDYARGGLCGTFRSDGDSSLIELHRQYDYQEAIYAREYCDVNHDEVFWVYSAETNYGSEGRDVVEDYQYDSWFNESEPVKAHSENGHYNNSNDGRDKAGVKHDSLENAESDNTLNAEYTGHNDTNNAGHGKSNDTDHKQYDSYSTGQRDTRNPDQYYNYDTEHYNHGAPVTDNDYDERSQVVAPRIAYRLHIHSTDDFWGSEDRHLTNTLSDAEMVTFNLLTTFSYQDLVIHVDREVLPNLRRQPCEEDPSYSQRTCWLRCFLDRLNCSIDGDGDKPTCSASETDLLRGSPMYGRYSEAFHKMVGLDVLPCSCPPPCVRERYSVFVRPGMLSSDQDFTVPVHFRPVRRTVETFVTYTFSDLLADMGGYLGLLLGYSLLSIFDDLKTVMRSVFGRWPSRQHIVGLDDALSVMESGAKGQRPQNITDKMPRENVQCCPGVLGRDRRTCWDLKDSARNRGTTVAEQTRESEVELSQAASVWEESNILVSLDMTNGKY